jgi:hypothetical protein
VLEGARDEERRLVARTNAIRCRDSATSATTSRCASSRRLRIRPARDAWHLDEVSITEAGAAVLEGKRDWLDLPLPERWVGGARIAPNALNWRWDERARTVALR